MINYLELLADMMSQPHYLLAILVVLYFMAGTLDFVVGTVNAVYSKTVEFSSRTAQLGIVRKLVTLAVMILIVPLALMLPLDVGVYSLTILYVGIVGSEIYSILGHVGIVKDGHKHKNLIGTLFGDLLATVFKTKDVDKKGDG